MASKIYTAQEMREMEKNIVRVDVMDGLTCREHCYPMEQVVRSMLRQAADTLEREEKCQYQYAARYFYPGGVIATDYIFDNPTDAINFPSYRDGAKKTICRRSVGEWEVVK